MAKSYLTVAELRTMFPTLGELQRNVKESDRKRWGLRINNDGFSFGYVSEGHRIVKALDEILEVGADLITHCGADNVIFFYGMDVISENVMLSYIRVGGDEEIHRPNQYTHHAL